MDIKELTSSNNIDLNQFKETRKVVDGEHGDFFLVKLDDSSLRALVFRDGKESKFVCAGNPGIWMEQVANEYDNADVSEYKIPFQSNVTCDDKTLRYAVSENFNLISSPSGSLELRKNLEDGFISITSLNWDEGHGESSITENEWIAARYENLDIANAEDISIVFVGEPINLQQAIMRSEILEEMDWTYTEEEMFFENWEDVKNFHRSVEMTM
jgi:hypothetical protein